MSCGDPGSPVNGKREGWLFQFGNTVDFTCLSGYELEGPKTRTCLANQTWSKTQPICKRKIERFSFERRKVIGFAITMPHDWLKKLVPHFHPIRSKTKTNRDSLARVFPRFASATCNYYEF